RGVGRKEIPEGSEDLGSSDGCSEPLPPSFPRRVELHDLSISNPFASPQGEAKLTDLFMDKALGAILSLKETVLAAGVASAATGCIVSAATCKSAVGASLALYESGLASNVGSVPQARAQAQTQINMLDSMLQSIQAQINDNVAQQSKPRFGAVLSAMCASIRQQCR